MANFAADSKYPAVAPICRAEQSDVQSLFNLTGKTALITGGNGGIGGGMARGLAEAGADIIIIQLPGEKSTFATELQNVSIRHLLVCSSAFKSFCYLRNVRFNTFSPSADL